MTIKVPLSPFGFVMVVILVLIAFAWLLLNALNAGAQQSASGYYATGMTPATGLASTSGKENSAVIKTSSGSGSLRASMIAALSYNTGASEVAMLFDAAALPSNGALPIAECPLATAASAVAPAPCSFSIPAGGMPLTSGLVVACSTTGSTLTVDTHSGGYCYFSVAYNP